MIACKKCNSEKAVKSGIINNKQRFRYKSCGCNFHLGDNRTNEKIAAKKALCTPLYRHEQKLLSHARQKPQHKTHPSIQVDPRFWKKPTTTQSTGFATILLRDDL